MVAGKVLSPQVVGLSTAPTLNGNVGVRVENGGVILTDALGFDANVTAVDLEAQNGVVHVIDKVLLPEDLRPVIFPAPVLPATVVDIAAGNPDFSSLVAAVNKAGLAGALTDPASPVTVFAPTNAAFDAALGALGLTLETIDVPTLTAVLLHHVVAGKVLSPQVVGLSTAATLNGNVGVRVENGGVILTDALGFDANVTAVDLEAQNGVVHVINKVLLPEDLRAVIGG